MTSLHGRACTGLVEPSGRLLVLGSLEMCISTVELLSSVAGFNILIFCSDCAEDSLSRFFYGDKGSAIVIASDVSSMAECVDIIQLI